ncbi:MAG: D-alanine--D-alanine ligase [Sedimentisphaerales bacterium]|nr:D-alanine--D-alanine ligase [Sedimentisphaerales bacterium]
MEGKIINRRRSSTSYDVVQSQQNNTLTITVLMGGPSEEREVSLNSGQAVCEALASSGHEVLPADIAPDDLSALDCDGVDVVFPVLHGRFGEDGQLQSIMEQRGLRFAGSDSYSSCLAMDKYRAKAAFRAAGLLTPTAALIRGQTDQISDRHDMISKALEKTGLPCVVKPNSQGSSIGVLIAENEHVAHESAEVTLARYGDCLIESYIRGREITVGILNSTALPIIEVRSGHRFYDYQAKYQDNHTEYNFDIDLKPRQLVAVRRQAMRAFAVLGCRDFGRVDMMVDEDGNGYLLEINTIPGFTSHSLLPKAAQRTGMSMRQMCDQIVQMAYRRPI